ncbi:GntR family transcriptional regulator [Ensifer sp. 4252]|uniref:GntR family transcriptional regulator n=1 Tax=Ensifer sp. 4252 TaxID=3373915 RepID=UPI003D1D88A5
MLESSSRSDVVYRLLRQAIPEQALKPGTKLSDDTIADHFKVSRTSVRGALVRRERRRQNRIRRCVRHLRHGLSSGENLRRLFSHTILQRRRYAGRVLRGRE